jgi:hypothetical protein
MEHTKFSPKYYEQLAVNMPTSNPKYASILLNIISILANYGTADAEDAYQNI